MHYPTVKETQRETSKSFLNHFLTKPAAGFFSKPSFM